VIGCGMWRRAWAERLTDKVAPWSGLIAWHLVNDIAWSHRSERSYWKVEEVTLYVFYDGYYQWGPRGGAWQLIGGEN